MAGNDNDHRGKSRENGLIRGGKTLFVRPAASSGFTDTESGNDGSGAERDLFALEAMRKRGLIDEATYERRKAALIARSEKP